MKEKITLHAVHCLISMLQITNLYLQMINQITLFMEKNIF